MSGQANEAPATAAPDVKAPVIKLWIGSGASTSSANLNVVRFTRPGLEGYSPDDQARIRLGLSQ
jgi:hypothetical protein